MSGSEEDGNIGGIDGLGLLQQLKLHDTHRVSNNFSQSPLMASFRDITKEFLAASEKLQVGQLVQDPEFTLFQAVGALEIMDPKMDSGLLEPDYERFDPWKPRLPEEIVGIMDRLLCNEMAWHQGSAVSQTLFASLYIDKLLSSYPTGLQQATFGPRGNTGGYELIQNVLRPYCIALIKSCGYVGRQVPSEHIYEEEDFVAQTYGLPLLQAVDQLEVVNLLSSALTWMAENEATFSGEIYTAIRNRLLLRKSLLDDLSRGGEHYHEGAGLDAWSESLELVVEVEKDYQLGKPVPDAWSMSVQRKLASSVPPRPLVEMPFLEATATLKQLCTETKDALKILTYAGATNTMTYFVHFGARRPTSLPFTRSLIQSLFLKDMKILGIMPLKCILFDDLQELCYPVKDLLDPKNFEVEAPQSPKFQIATRMKWFVERAGRAYIELYRSLCQNRARFRRILCKSIADWDSMQVECEEVDKELQTFTHETGIPQADGGGGGIVFSFPLSSWVYHTKLRLMETITLLGFELDIFQPHEFDGMYWYLQFYLRTRSDHIERIRSFVRTREEEGEEPYQKTMSLLNFLLLESSAMQDLASSCVYLYAALNRYPGALGGRVAKMSLDEELLQYEGRMKPFLSVGCPEVVRYETFRAVVDNVDVSTNDLLAYAAGHVADAKKAYLHLSKLPAATARAVLCEGSYRAEMQRLLRSCFGVGVAIAVFLREVGGSGGGKIEVVLDRAGGYHPAFPVPCIKVKSAPPTPPVAVPAAKENRKWKKKKKGGGAR